MILVLDLVKAYSALFYSVLELNSWAKFDASHCKVCDGQTVTSLSGKSGRTV